MYRGNSFWWSVTRDQNREWAGSSSWHSCDTPRYWDRGYKGEQVAEGGRGALKTFSPLALSHSHKWTSGYLVPEYFPSISFSTGKICSCLESKSYMEKKILGCMTVWGDFSFQIIWEIPSSDSSKMCKCSNVQKWGGNHSAPNQIKINAFQTKSRL